MAEESLNLTPVGTPVYSTPEYWQEIKPKNEKNTELEHWSTQVLCTQPFESLKCQSLKAYCSGKEAVCLKLRKAEVFRYYFSTNFIWKRYLG